MPLRVPALSPCPFCENLDGRYVARHGPPAVVHADDLIVAFLAPVPLGGLPGHTLVTTRRHVETVFDLDSAEEKAIGGALTAASRSIRAVIDLDGLLIQQHNGADAFQTVPHVHFHVIPRKKGATFPPIPLPDMVPNEERQSLAAELRSHWS